MNKEGYDVHKGTEATKLSFYNFLSAIQQCSRVDAIIGNEMPTWRALEELGSGTRHYSTRAPD